MEPNISYDSDNKTPQEIRNDFIFLADTFDPKYVIKAIASQLNTDQLAELIDDFNMGRIWPILFLSHLTSCAFSISLWTLIISTLYNSLKERFQQFSIT